MVYSGVLGEPFERRVRALHETWAERRQVKLLATAHDFASQLRLLATLHSWTREAARGITVVYGDALDVTVSPLPTAESPPVFTIAIDERFIATFALVERRRAGARSWHLEVAVGLAEPGRQTVAAGPERRNGNWTRSRLEDVLLSLLGAYERSLADGIELKGEALDSQVTE